MKPQKAFILLNNYLSDLRNVLSSLTIQNFKESRNKREALDLKIETFVKEYFGKEHFEEYRRNAYPPKIYFIGEDLTYPSPKNLETFKDDINQRISALQALGDIIENFHVEEDLNVATSIEKTQSSSFIKNVFGSTIANIIGGLVVAVIVFLFLTKDKEEIKEPPINKEPVMEEKKEQSKIEEKTEEPKKNSISSYNDLGNNLYEILYNYNKDTLGYIYIPPKANLFCAFNQSPIKSLQRSNTPLCNLVERNELLQKLGEYINTVKNSDNKLIVTADTSKDPNNTGVWMIGGQIKYGKDKNNLKYPSPSDVWNSTREWYGPVLGWLKF